MWKIEIFAVAGRKEVFGAPFPSSSTAANNEFRAANKEMAVEKFTYFVEVHPFVSLNRQQRPPAQQLPLEHLQLMIAFVDGIALSQIL